jgi:hypothetical protein
VTASALRIPAAEIFASEVEEAKRLGFKLQLNLGGQLSIAVRLIPQTKRARVIAGVATSYKSPGFIEAPCAVPEDATTSDRLDLARDAIRSALELARDTGA